MATHTITIEKYWNIVGEENRNIKSEDSIEQFSSRPDFMVLCYPVISMSKNIMHAGSRNNLIGNTPADDLAKLYSNELQVTKQTPPTFLVHANDDRAVPVENSLLFYQALKDNGVTIWETKKTYFTSQFKIAESVAK